MDVEPELVDDIDRPGLDALRSYEIRC